MVEFAFAGTVFFLIVFGTIDFGRVIFSYAQLHNAVREGARYAKVHCPDTPDEQAAVKAEVIAAAPHLTLNPDPTKFIVDLNQELPPSEQCAPPEGWVRVKAEADFTAVIQTFLDIDSIKLSSSTQVDVE